MHQRHCNTPLTVLATQRLYAAHGLRRLVGGQDAQLPPHLALAHDQQSHTKQIYQGFDYNVVPFTLDQMGD